MSYENDLMNKKLICRFEEARDGLISELAKKYLAGSTVLELGCGEGDRTKLFYKVTPSVTGVDIADRVRNDHKAHFKFMIADACNLPFEDQGFDGVVSFDVIEHIEDDITFLREAFRLCRKGDT